MRRRDLLTGAAAVAANSALADGIYNAGAPNVSVALDGIGLPWGAGGYRLWKPTDLASLVSWLDPNIPASVRGHCFTLSKLTADNSFQKGPFFSQSHPLYFARESCLSVLCPGLEIGKPCNQRYFQKLEMPNGQP